ncbi:MAG TPA: Crp/Fnr family transcriptional regulator, partial [Cytophagales bacterium]|nr:Crp/Fnr family transcriptional regulator [Cytophagales bacterium]
IPAKTVMLHVGQVEYDLYFISKGIVKGYRNIEGCHVVEHLAGEGQFFSALESLLKNKPSELVIEAVTACEGYKIKKADYDQILHSDSKLKGFLESLMSSSILCKMNRINDFQTLSARQRYEKLLAAHPKMVLNTPVETIASYLGMEPQSLSRIRKQLTN